MSQPLCVEVSRSDTPPLKFIQQTLGGNRHAYVKVGDNDFVIHGNARGARLNKKASERVQDAGHRLQVFGNAIYFHRNPQYRGESCIVAPHFVEAKAKAGEHVVVIAPPSKNVCM